MNIENAQGKSIIPEAEWDSSMFNLAQKQFLGASEIMGLDNNIRNRLLFPQRAQIASFPCRKDKYSEVETVFGYRVQHVLTMGPTKGGIRYHEDVNLGEVSALAMWMTWKTSLAGLPYGGGKGEVESKVGSFVVINGESYHESDVEVINEAKKKKKKEKKDPPLGKPKRGGSKAYYVYVRDPKTKKIKKVSFGSGGLRAKIKNKKARNAFASRHNCDKKKDRTTAGYWSCNLPRYADQLGLGSKMNTFW